MTLGGRSVEEVALSVELERRAQLLALLFTAVRVGKPSLVLSFFTWKMGLL